MSEQNNLNLAINALEQQYLASRNNFLSHLGYNQKYNKLWCEAGYSTYITPEQLFQMYSRNGYAKGAISSIMNTVWETNPFIVDGDKDTKAQTKETPTEKDIKKFARKKRLWSYLKQADTARAVCEYAGLIIQVADNKKWDEPLESLTDWNDIVGFRVAWQHELSVSDRDNNQQSANYQKPTKFSYIEWQDDGVTNKNSRSNQNTVIHASRVFLFGDVYGIGNDSLGNKVLVPGYNALTALEQINAAGTAGSVKAAAQHMTWEFEQSSAISDIAKQYGVPITDMQGAFQKMTDRVNQNLDSAIIASGAKISTLDVNMPDLDQARQGPMEEFAASVGVPVTELKGFETGERSSEQNNKTLRKNSKARQTDVETPEIESFFEYLQSLGLWKGRELTCDWNDLLEPTLSEKLENANLMADANQKMMGSGQQVFTVGEMRTTSDFEAEPELTQMEKDLQEEGEGQDPLPEDE